MRLHIGTKTTTIKEIIRIKVMVKKLNGYLLTKKIRQKHLVKVCTFLGAKNQLYDGPCETNFKRDTREIIL